MVRAFVAVLIVLIAALVGARHDRVSCKQQ